MEPSLAQELGLIPPDGGVESPPSSSGGGILDEQRLQPPAHEGDSPAAERSETPTAGSSRPQSVEARLAALEAENQQLRSQSQLPDDPIVAGQVYYQTKSQEIEGQCQMAYAGLLQNEVAAGEMTQAQALREIQNLRSAALAQVRADSQTIMTLPASRLMLADRIAKEYSVGEIKLTADDVMAAATGGPEAMKARAQTLQEERRNSSYQRRASRGTDRAEGGASSGTIDPRALDKLSAGQIIKLGVQRGHFS